MSRPVRINETNLMPYWLKNPPRPKEMTQHEQQVEELRAQGTSQEVNYGSSIPPPNIPKFATAPTPIITRGVFDSAIYFDSLRREAANYADAALQFQTRVLNNNTDLTNVVQLRLSRFYFPRPTWPEPIKSQVPDYLYLRKLYMFIQELPSTSTVGTAAGRQYHFELDVQNINSISTELVPINKDLYLPTPISTLNQLTFKFYLPPDMTPVILYQDTLTALHDTDPEDFRFINPTDYQNISTEFDLSVIAGGGLLTTPVGIWFTALDPPASSNAIRPEGWFIVELYDFIAFPPYGGFRIATPPPTGIAFNTAVTFQIRKNRFAFEMRFSQMQTPTATGLIPTHV
jgi:hypothetical protein